MAGERGDQPEERSLEARVAELEDRLSRIQITEEEIAAFRKVSALLAAGGRTAATGMPGAAAGVAGGAAAGAVEECGVNECGVIRPPIMIRQPIIRQCTFECFECGPGLPGGTLGGSFGGLGA